MPVDPSVSGRVYPPSPMYEVGREKIREFADALGAQDAVHRAPEAPRALGYPDVIAPPTFAVIAAQRSEAQLFSDPDVRIDYSRVVHGEESFIHHRPIVAGDRLVGTLHVDGARQAGGHTMVTTRVELATESGERVSTVVSTIVERGGAE